MESQPHTGRSGNLFLLHFSKKTDRLASLSSVYTGDNLPLNLLTRERQRFRGGLSSAHLKLAKSMLSAREHDSRTLIKLAAACNLSPGHFAREFKKTTGLPPHQWALQNKVNLAKQLILESSLSLAEIAPMCGFVDHSHLSRWFKRITGINPKTWHRSQPVLHLHGDVTKLDSPCSDSAR